MVKQIENGEIEFNAQVADGIYRCDIKLPQIAAQAMPGNFVNVSVNDNSKLLKRPFGIHDVNGQFVSILYRTRGAGTGLMSKFSAGDKVDVIGPLGNSFPVCKDKRVLILGGGMGIAPVFFLEKELSKKNDVTTLYAVKSKQELVDLNVSHLLVHVDEEAGGFVIDKLEKVISDNKIDIIYTCGPDIMMKSAASIAKAWA